MEKYVIKLPCTDNILEIKSCDEGVEDFIENNIDYFFEIVRNTLLGYPYVLLVDDEGLLKENCKLNLIGTLLYQNPIVGDVYIMKEGYVNGESDLIPLVKDECIMIHSYCHRLSDNK